MAAEQRQQRYAIGMVGLGVMGRNFLLNIGGGSG
jgi:6-phosphogluconate dehydrogenase